MQENIPYVICRMSDIPSQRAYGFCLTRLDDEGTASPWPIIVVRWGRKVFGYVNKCPHDGVNLDWERGQFLDSDGTQLMCGKHGALFDLATGECVEGACKGSVLEGVSLAVIDDDICVLGVTLAEDDGEDG
jgi:nitrite reductase/ring-hydroxylating ferredoxin subunit